MVEDSARPSHSVVSVLASLGALVMAVVACGPGNVASNLAGVTKREAEPHLVIPKVDCPNGTTWDGAKCAGIASTECAAGMRFEAGRGCVGNVVSAAVQSDTPRGSPAPAPQGEVAGMVSIPAGSFLMGSNDGEADEKPVHRVSVAGFAMDVTEVTTAAYTACVRAGRCSAASTDGYCNYGHSDKNNHPINCVDWGQATAYCASVGKRLPTEEEWEYAARGTDGRKYSWGNEEPGTRACWSRWSNVRPIDPWGNKEGTCSVGSCSSGVFGLKDMNGNVWEWTSTVHSIDYSNSRADTALRTRPVPLEEMDARVRRGGGWYFGDPSDLRSSNRDGFAPSLLDSNLGFRCAR
jgi:formylglycine-generating enzyme required for sulfatase activity